MGAKFLAILLAAMRVGHIEDRRAVKESPERNPGFFNRASTNECGFTLPELIVTLVVAGILAAVALPRWQGDAGFEARKFRDETVAALRLAQKTAIAARRTVCTNFAAGQVSLTLSTAFGAPDCAGGSALNSPSGGPMIVTATGGASFSPVPASIVFDAAGRPIQGAGMIFVSGLAGMPIIVEAETGYVH